MTRSKTPEPNVVPPISVAEFLQSSPPGQTVAIKELGKTRTGGLLPAMRLPLIQLHCDSEHCNGLRFFKCEKEAPTLNHGGWINIFLSFHCRNCSTRVKTYALAVRLDEAGLDGAALKFGEHPAFGPPTPARVITLIGPDRELFLMGRRCENQGMGIGAFVYYRRVIENQKNRMLDEIVRVATKLGAADELLADLNTAKEEQQFAKAIDSIKHAIPQALMIDGHNPLNLLHSALSEGLHAQSDEECLGLAHSIRVVLTELAERLGQALKDEAELNAAIARLQAKKAKKANPAAD